MKSYEIALLLKEGEHIPESKERIKEYLSRLSGKITTEEDLGLRDLAYTIHKNREKFTRAYYYFLKAELDPQSVGELARMFKYDEAIIRHMFLVE